MLTVDNLVKDFISGFKRKKTTVLRGVTFSVSTGDIFGFIGPNGSGKTTTFKCVLGFIPITSGEIQIFNRPNDDVELKKKIGYLPENPYFYDYLTGEELLRYMGQLHGIDSKTLSIRIDDLLEKVKMSHARGLQLRKYSKGMLQRVGLAQALINDPEFLILDEPMSGLDPIGQREIRELILELKSKGKTILLSSHILTDVESLCDRVGVIFNGRIVKVGELQELFSEIHTDYEMVIRNIDQSRLSDFTNLGVSFEKRAGFQVIRFDEDLKSKVVDLLHKYQIDMISLTPLRKSLEGLFEEQTKKEAILET